MNLKRVLALCLVCLLTLTPMLVLAQSPYSDVTEDHWAYDAIVKLADAGIITDFPDGEFKGEVTLTRYEMAMVIYRALQYVVENVERMNRSQTALVSDLLTDLVNEFDRELRAISNNLDDIRKELERVKQRQESWNFDVTTSVNGVFRKVEGPGVAYDDPFADDKKKLHDEESVTPKLSIHGSGHSNGFDVSFETDVEAVFGSSSSGISYNISGFYLNASNERVSVQAGSLRNVSYAPYLLSKADDKIHGIEVGGVGNVFFNDAVKVAYVYYHDDGKVVATPNSVIGVRLDHKVGNFTASGILGFAYDGDPTTQDQRIVGLQAGYQTDRFGVIGDIAFDHDMTPYRAVKITTQPIDVFRSTFTYTNVPADFDGLLVDANLVEPGDKAGLRIEVDPISLLTLYGDTSYDFESEQFGYKIGADFEYPIIDELTVHADVNYNGSEIGYLAEITYTEGELVTATAGIGREDGQPVLKIGARGKSEIGVVGLKGAIVLEKKGNDHYTTFGGGFVYKLNNYARFNFDLSRSIFDAEDPSNNYTVNEAMVSVSFSF